jgi:hypothetical protein
MQQWWDFNILSMKINDKLSSGSLTVANAFNVYFSFLDYPTVVGL